jgi:hypothetical protein
MESEEKLMTGEESLKIITDMINKTKVSIAQSSFHLLFWGWLILLCSISDYVLWKYFGYTNSWYVWYFVIPGAFVSLIYGFTKGKREKVFTYGTSIYVSVWIGFLLAGIVLFIINSKSMEIFGKNILMLAGFPTFVCGFILKFKPLILGGLAFWVLAIVANYAGPDIAGLCMPVAIVLGYLLPGYLLKRKDRHDAIQGA